MGKLLGEELEETPESYWRAAERADAAGFRTEASSLRTYASFLKKEQIGRRAICSVFIVGIAAILYFQWFR